MDLSLDDDRAAPLPEGMDAILGKKFKKGNVSPFRLATLRQYDSAFAIGASTLPRLTLDLTPRVTRICV